MANKPEETFVLALFEINIQNYPHSDNIYNSMGDYYVEQADTAKAIEHLTKALELGTGPESQEKLDNLKPGS